MRKHIAFGEIQYHQRLKALRKIVEDLTNISELREIIAEKQNLAHSLPRAQKMLTPENRVVIEELIRQPQHLKKTAVRIGEVAALVSTVVLNTSSPDLDRIETATFRIKGVIAKGMEGEFQYPDSKRLVTLLPYSNQFLIHEKEAALGFHGRVVDAIADLLENDPSQLERIEQEQLRD